MRTGKSFKELRSDETRTSGDDDGGRRLRLLYERPRAESGWHRPGRQPMKSLKRCRPVAHKAASLKTKQKKCSWEEPAEPSSIDCLLPRRR